MKGLNVEIATLVGLFVFLVIVVVALDFTGHVGKASEQIATWAGMVVVAVLALLRASSRRPPSDD